jgi:Copper type II ascorbate-dependent monooxygenase, C-terminal domain
MKTILFAVLGMAAVGCGTNGPDYIAGFDPPAVQDGYTRYVAPVVDNITPGADIEMCEWVAPVATEDQEVLDVTGLQSTTGHHAVLFATTETNFKVGESHICTPDDMVSVSFIGAVVSTGAQLTQLPEGLFFRLRKGQALMMNTHWLNATDKTVEGQAVVDVKYGAADPSHTIADIFANNGDTFMIPPGAPTQYDVSCTFPQDMNFAMVTDHMHTAGTSAYTEVLHTDGTSTMLRQDTSWASDEQFNPIYTMFSLAQPYVVHTGDTIHTHCEWQNQGTSTLLFPDEMCAGQAFYFPGNGLSACDDGTWGVGGPID